MTAIAAGRIERNRTPLRRNYVSHEIQRSVTDKFGIIILIIAIILWILAGPRVVNGKPKSKIDSNNINENDSELIGQNFTNSTSSSINETPGNDVSEYFSRIWGNNWFIDVVLCNIGFLDTNYERSGSIVLYAHVLFSIFLILYSFSSMRAYDMYCQQFFDSLKFFTIINFLCREKYIFIILNEKTTLRRDSACDLILWSLPDLILFIIAFSKYVPPKLTDHGIYNRDLHIPWISYLPFVWFSIFLLYFPLALLAMKYKFVMDDESSNILAISLMLYFCLIYYYFLLMVTSCAISLSFNRQNSSCRNYVRALFIVMRYHFGTVCYQATLILPRIQATFVMNEAEIIRTTPKLSKRLYLTHWKVHDISPAMTATNGSNHSGSIKDLLRLFTSGSSKIKNFQTHKKLFKTGLVLQMGIFCLINISLWIHGVMIDPSMMTGMWNVLFFGAFGTYVILRFYDATSDVLWYHYDGTAIIVF